MMFANQNLITEVEHDKTPRFHIGIKFLSGNWNARIYNNGGN